MSDPPERSLYVALAVVAVLGFVAGRSSAHRPIQLEPDPVPSVSNEPRGRPGWLRAWPYVMLGVLVGVLVMQPKGIDAIAGALQALGLLHPSTGR